MCADPAGMQWTRDLIARKSKPSNTGLFDAKAAGL